MDFLVNMTQYAEKGIRIVECIDFKAFQSNGDKVVVTIKIIEVIGEIPKHIPIPHQKSIYWIPLEAVSLGCKSLA
jgi:uncharacterized protein with HEPN domain